MRGRWVVGAWTVGAALGAVAFQACTFNSTIIEQVIDAGPGAGDAGVGEGAAADAQAASCDGGVVCSGSCVQAGDCSSCSGAPLLCAATGQCVATCAGCNDTQGKAMPIECFTCDAHHANPLGTCGYAEADAYCLSGNYFGSYNQGAGYHCACGGDAGACPGASQVCVAQGALSICATCGETIPVDLSGLACKQSGTKCDPSAHACR